MGLDRSPDQLIRAGLAALKQKKYERAIATFQQVRQNETVSLSYRLKAQMGLIRTYEAQGDKAQARELCNLLLKSRSQAIRQWGHEKIRQLGADAASLPSQQEETAAANNNISQVSGFVPFDKNVETSSFHGSENIVEVPKSGESEHSQLIANTDNLSPTTASSRLLEEKQSADSSSFNETTVESGKKTSKENPSLFHYQALNSRQTLERTSDHAVEGTSLNVDDSLVATKTQADVASAVHLDTVRQTTPTNKSKIKTVQGPDTWPSGGRLTTLKSLGKVSMGRLWFAQLATTVLLFWVVRWLVQTTLLVSRNYFQFLDDLLPFRIPLSPIFWFPHTWTVIVSLCVLALASPWLWPLLLGARKPLPIQALREYSPESEQLLRRFCAKRRWQVPAMELLSTDLPLIFSYGWRPRYGRLVVSQGLLECLANDEVAAILMYEMSHWSNWDWVFFSIHGLLVQLCHRTYWFFARWGESRPILLKVTAGILATLSYGVFWLLAKVGCGLSRTRVPYRDRMAAEITGNPNGLIRGLAKMSSAMQKAVEKTGHTPPPLERLELMLPVAPEHAVTIQEFAWGALHPLRHWFSINQGHPPLGDRLYTLEAYGRHWRLKPSLNFARFRLQHGKRPLTGQDWQTLVLWGGLWSGALIGLGLAVLMWLIGAIAASLDFQLLAWLHGDRSILLSMPLIIAATVQLIRINPLFPEIPALRSINESQITTWQTDTKLTPLSSLPVKVNGTLTGRPALANWLGQEWRLHTDHGSFKLHYVSYLGPISNLTGLSSSLDQALQVTGWFRRGHHLWIDLERWQEHKGHIQCAHPPIWSVIISLVLLIYGVWLLMIGG
ncbi:MAG: zinc metalloprotease HtpX [Cyanobacteria bacterium P01_D01_bin.56]